MKYSFMSTHSVKARLLRIFLVLPLIAAGQQGPARPQQVQSQVQPASGPAQFSASTNVVVEEVSVKDKDGKAIEGLKKEDFAVTEDNKSQEIKFFDYEKL